MNANGSLTSNTNWYWERSRYYNYSNHVCRVYDDGSAGNNGYNGSIGLAPGYIPLVERYLAQEPAVYHTPIVAAHYQHDAGLIGAALLAEDKAL